MAPQRDDDAALVLTVRAVRWAINDIKLRRIHPFFLAYLFLRKWGLEQGTTTEIKPNWDEIARFIAIAGGPPKKPLFRPFQLSPSADSSRLWFNRNVAGSFAPSSLRKVPYRVVGTQGSHFSLNSLHAEQAFEHLLFKEQLPSVALAAFLYRDFVFTGASADGAEPVDLVDLFRSDFRFTADDSDFDVLFATVLPTSVHNWFEPFSPLSEGIQ